MPWKGVIFRCSATTQRRCSYSSIQAFVTANNCSKRSHLLSLMLLGEGPVGKSKRIDLVWPKKFPQLNVPSQVSPQRPDKINNTSLPLQAVSQRNAPPLRCGSAIRWCNHPFFIKSGGVEHRRIKRPTTTNGIVRTLSVRNHPSVPEQGGNTTTTSDTSNHSTRNIQEWMQSLTTQTANEIDDKLPSSVVEQQENLHRMLQQWVQSFQEHAEKNESVDFVVSPMEMHKFCVHQLSFPLHVVAFGFLIDGLVLEQKWRKKNKQAATPPISYGELGERILDDMLQHLEQTQPTATTDEANTNNATADVFQPSFPFHKVMRLYCQERRIADAERLLVDKLEPIGGATRDSYTIVLSARARRGQPREAEFLLDRMIHHRTLVPTRENFESCLNAWVTSRTKNAGQRAEVLVLRMQEMYQERQMEQLRPTHTSLSKVAAAWVNSRHPDATHRVETVLATMYELRDDDDNDEQATKHKTLADTHLLLCKLWSHNSSRDAPQKCHESIHVLDAHVGLDQVDPGTVQNLYAALIFSWAACRHRRDEIPAQIRSILQELRQRSQRTNETTTHSLLFLSKGVYHALFHAYAKTGDRQSAGWLLTIMIQNYLQQQQQQDGFATTTTGVVAPDIKAFNSVLLAWNRSKQRPATVAAEQCCHLLESMDTLHNDNKNGIVLHKDIVTYNTFLAIMGKANSLQYSHVGHDRLMEMKDEGLVEPTRATFTYALQLWTGVRSSTIAVERMEEYLTWMLQTSATTTTQPEEDMMYRTCKDIIQKSPLGKSAAAEKLAALKDTMVKLQEQKSDRRRGKR